MNEVLPKTEVLLLTEVYGILWRCMLFDQLDILLDVIQSNPNDIIGFSYVSYSQGPPTKEVLKYMINAGKYDYVYGVTTGVSVPQKEFGKHLRVFF